MPPAAQLDPHAHLRATALAALVGLLSACGENSPAPAQEQEQRAASGERAHDGGVDDSVDGGTLADGPAAVDCQPTAAEPYVCLLRLGDAPPSGDFSAEVLSATTVTAADADPFGCSDAASAVRAGQWRPGERLRIELGDGDGNRWLLETKTDVPLLDAVGTTLDIRISGYGGEFWLCQGVRIEDDEGLVATLGCDPPGVVITPSRATCALDVAELACARQLYSLTTTVELDGTPVPVPLGEHVEHGGYRFSATSGQFDYCGPSEAGPTRAVGVVRLP